MLIKVINLNCKEKEYDFNMSIVTDEKWTNFVQNIVQARVENKGALKINGSKIVIRDNKAKVKVFYQDASYHEVAIMLDEFGRISKDYQDIISKIWQDIMLSYYGNKYAKVLETKKETLKI